MIQDLLIWPNDDVVMWTGVATGIYGSLPGRSIGTPVEVSILHLESGQYWRPNGEFGEAMSHTGSVVASDGHWRLSVSPPAGGTYRLVVVASASDGSAVSATTEFSVMGEDLISPFVNASAEDLVEASADSSTTPALPETAISDSFPILDAASRQFWDGRRGIGFSVDSQGQWLTQQRLESALQEVSSLGFDTIRTWGTNDYTGRILAAIDQMDLDLKVQAGIYITNGSNAEQLIDQALDVIQPYEQHILGLSLGNEQLADWNPSALQVSDVREHVQMFRERSDLLITYNFAGETLRPESSFWSQQGEALLQDLDYINVHSYAGFFDNRLNPEWTPQRQLEVLKTDEALFRSVLDGFNLNDTPLILGETGWQSGGYAEEVTNAINMETYFQNVDQYIASDAAVFDNMFYFNFSDESWKGPDDYWGLFTEGNELGLGNAKFDGSINSLLISAPATDSTLNLNLTLISDSGSARLLVDESTGLAYVQKGEDDPVVIQRNDDYWSDEVPVERGQAQLVAAAVDDLGRLRVLDRSQQWGDFGWILDDNGYFIGEEGPGDTTVASNEILFLKDLDGDQLIGTEEVSTDLEPIADQSPPPSPPETDSTLNLNLTLISDSGSARLLVDESTGLAYVQKGEDDPVVIQRNDDYWSDEVPVERGQAQLVAAAVDDLGRLRVLDRSQQWGDFGWILDDNGYFIGEEGPGDTTVASNEILFLKDLDGDQLIGTEEVSTDLEPIADQSPPPSPPETDSTLNLNLTLISDSGSARLLVDESTGLAYVQKGEDDPVVIQRNDDYWSDEVPVERGQAQLVAAAVDDLGRLRVLDRSQQWGDFGWILDDNGYFIGEEGPGDTTVASNEILFLKDLDGDQLIGTANESNASQPSPDQINPFDVTGFSQGEFLSTIAFSHRATADPIVAPGNANFMHAHDFFANTSTDENSTVSSLLAAGSTAAQPSNNLSTYWAPSLIDEGADGLGGEWSYITPKATSIAYYSVLSPNDPNQLVNMPTGLKMITGSARPMERQSRAQVFWNYIGESASYDHIPLGDEWRDLPLQAVLLFQDHWNGEQLDSSDHKSHLAFGAGSDEHPLLIPQLQLQIHYGRIDNNLHLVSSDYMNLPEEGSELNRRLREASEVDLSFRNDEAGFAPGWSMHADHIHLPWEETAPNGQQVDGFARREVDALQNTPLFAGIDGNAVRPIPTGISQPYSSDLAMLPILGTPGVDVLIGTDADDRMEALEGNDTLIGGLGGDHLVGGDGVDSFVFQSINDSTWVNPDEIIGFAADDRIDLSALNLAADVIQLEQMNPSSWMLSAIGTDLAVEIRTGQIGLEQILLT